MVARLYGGSAAEAETIIFICNMYYVYCLESIKCDKLYIGKTGNLKKRYKEHNSKRGGEFTSKNGPWKLIFYEAFLSKK